MDAGARGVSGQVFGDHFLHHLLEALDRQAEFRAFAVFVQLLQYGLQLRRALRYYGLDTAIGHKWRSLSGCYQLLDARIWIFAVRKPAGDRDIATRGGTYAAPA